MPVAAAVVGNDRVGAVFAALFGRWPPQLVSGDRSWRSLRPLDGSMRMRDGRHHLQLVEADVPGIGSAPSEAVVAENIRGLKRSCRWKPVSSGRPKTLYGACRCQEKTCHALSHFVTSFRLHCGTAALLLGCAERSEPRSRVRRAEGAGLDRECADRARISLPRRTNVLRALFDLLCGFLFCRFSFHRHASRSLKIRFDMIRGELAIGRGKPRHNLVFGRSARIGAMMQSYASAAKLRGGGSILQSGLEAMVLRRITATSDSSANP
jgi:hypothetical protein